MDSLLELEERLSKLVRSASDARAYERFSMRGFRESALRTLADIRQDQRIHGDENAPFFDLIMFDANPVEPAVFLVPMFFEDSVKIYVGTGLPNEVISMVNQFAMADVDGMAAELRSRGAADALEVPRALAVQWLGNV